MQKANTLLLAAVLSLSAMLGTALHAQGIPFLNNLPSNSIVGRLGSGRSGPAQAIPLRSLQATSVIVPDPANTADVTINAAIAALPSEGGTVDLRPYGCGSGSYAGTIASTINVGTGNQQVTLIIDSCTEFNVTISNNTPVFSINNNSSIVAFGSMSQANQINFDCESGCSIRSFFENSNKTNGFGIQLNNLIAAAGNGTVSKGGMWFQGVHGVDVIANVEMESVHACGLLIDDSASAGTTTMYFYNLWMASTGTDTSQPLCINSNASGQGVSDINFYGGSFESAGPNLPNIQLKQATGGGTIKNINFFGVMSGSINASSPHMKITGATNVGVFGLSMQVEGAASTDCIQIANGPVTNAADLVFYNLNCPSSTHIINDQVNSSTYSQTSLPSFIYGDTNGNFSILTASGSTGGSTVAVSQSGLPISVGAAVFNPTFNFNGSGASALPSCATGTKGLQAFVTDGVTSPAYRGTYSAGAGSVPVWVYCDGTNWRYQ